MIKHMGNDFLRGKSLAFLTLVTFLVIVFLTGGGSRSDIQALIVLRPVAALACFLALWRLSRVHIRQNRHLFGFAATMLVLVVIHLVPLPPAIWMRLPGRELVAQIDAAAGLDDIWRPITLVPTATRNALYSLFVPLAVLLLGVQTTREERFQLLPVLLGLGLFSGLIGMLQAIGAPSGALYFYEVTNNGSAVGLFANRNHQAIFLTMLLPALAVFAGAGARGRSGQSMKARSWSAIVAGTALVPLILVTGSRTGLALGCFGLAAAAAIYRKPETSIVAKRKVVKFDWRYPIAGFGVLCLAAITVIMSRAEAIRRLAASDDVEEQRFLVWGPIAEAARTYFPVGSGIGSFVETYRIHEKDSLLNPFYLNHAHNDWLELFLTGGLPAVALLVIGLFCYLRVARELWRTRLHHGRDVQYAKLGFVMILVLALASVVDYPVRTPILACVFVVSVLWLWSPTKDLAKTAGDSGPA
jgi:O-antigen ligase